MSNSLTPEENGDDCTEVPAGAAVFPLIPEELGIHPLLLATLHAVVFLDGSDVAVVNVPAAEEALNYLAAYLQRLRGPDLKRIQEDIECLIAFGKQEDWPKEEMQFLAEFLKEFGVVRRLAATPKACVRDGSTNGRFTESGLRNPILAGIRRSPESVDGARAKHDF